MALADKYTPEQIEQMKSFVKDQGMTPEEAIRQVQSAGKQNIFQKSFSRAGERFKETTQQFKQLGEQREASVEAGKTSPIQAFMEKLATEGIGPAPGVKDVLPVFRAAEGAAEPFVEKAAQAGESALQAVTSPLQDLITKVFSEEKLAKAGDKLVKPVADLIGWWGGLDEDTQRVLKEGGLIAETGLNLLGAAGAVKATKPKVRMAGQRMSQLKEKIDTAVQSGVVPRLEQAAEVLQPGAADVIDDAAPGLATFITEQTDDATRSTFTDMLDIAEEIKGEFSPDKKVFDPIGEGIAERVTFLAEQGEDAGAAKSSAIQAMPDQPIDIVPQYESFIGKLEEAGVKIKNGKLDFSGTRYSGKKNAATRSLIKDVFNDLQPNKEGIKQLTPLEIDRLRQKYFDELALGAADKTFSKPGSTLVSTVRDDLIEPLRAIDDRLQLGYIENAQKFAQTREALVDFLKKIGYKGDLDSADALQNIKSRSAEVVRRIRGNAASLVEKELDPIVELSQQFGFTGADIRQQVDFALFLEDLFKLTQKTNRTSLRGSVESALETADIIKDAAAGRFAALIEKGLNKVTGKTLEDQVKALRELLQSSGGKPQ